MKKLYRVYNDKNSEYILTTSKNRALELSEIKSMEVKKVEIINKKPEIKIATNSKKELLNFVEIDGKINVTIDSNLYKNSELELIVSSVVL